MATPWRLADYSRFIVSTVRIYLDDSRVGPIFRRISAKVAPAVRSAAQDAADEIKTETRDDVRAGGRFGPRWYPDTSVRIGGGNVRIDVVENVPYWRIFQTGGTISRQAAVMDSSLGVQGNDAALASPAKKLRTTFSRRPWRR